MRSGPINGLFERMFETEAGPLFLNGAGLSECPAPDRKNFFLCLSDPFLRFNVSIEELTCFFGQSGVTCTLSHVNGHYSRQTAMRKGWECGTQRTSMSVGNTPWLTACPGLLADLVRALLCCMTFEQGVATEWGPTWNNLVNVVLTVFNGTSQKDQTRVRQDRRAFFLEQPSTVRSKVLVIAWILPPPPVERSQEPSSAGGGGGGPRNLRRMRMGVYYGFMQPSYLWHFQDTVYSLARSLRLTAQPKANQVIVRAMWQSWANRSKTASRH